jgi:acetyl esterase/lipase
MRWLLLLLVLAPGSLDAQSRGYPPSLDGARVETYKRTGDVELRLWIFDPPDRPAGELRPAIVFFFGGGWKSGSPTQFEQQCRYFAAQGMVAITADYRVRERHGTTADKCVADAKSAIRWVRQNAPRLGIDPERIVAGGGSAGGHLAACTGVIPGLDEPGEPAQVSSVPNALALFNPALVLAPVDGAAIADDRRADIASRTGVDPQQISPIHHVRGGLPPTIIFHGEADVTVPLATAQLYAQRAIAAGNRCELVTYKGAGHGFFNHGRGGTPGEHYVATVQRLHQFLYSLGYLDGPPEKQPGGSREKQSR